MAELANLLNISKDTLYISIVLLLLVFFLQYYLFIYSNFKIKNFLIGIGIFTVINLAAYIYVKYNVDNPLLVKILNVSYKLSFSNGPMLLIVLPLQRIVFSIRSIRFEMLLKKCHAKVQAKALKKLAKVTVLNFRINDIKKAELEQLKSIHRDAKNDTDIALEIRIAYSKALVSIGIPDITVPRTYNINIDKRSTTNDVLKVARGALNEAKLIVDIAPNACVFSCRKYAENIAKYLIKHHNVKGGPEDDLDNFSTLLYLLNKSAVIGDQKVKQSFYHIKEVGNDAAHGQLCDKKTAGDIFEDSMSIESWFNMKHKEIA